MYARKHLFLKISFYPNPKGWLIFNGFPLGMKVKMPLKIKNSSVFLVNTI